MEYIEIKKAAHDRELSIIKVGGVNYALYRSRTGEKLGQFPKDDLEALLAKVEEYPVIVKVVPETVGWNAIIPPAAPQPLRCPNNFGADCFCLDTTLPYVVCGLDPHCGARARCKGVCVHHLAQAHGKDFTKLAIQHTDHWIKEHGLDLENPEVNFKFRPMKSIQQTGRLSTSLTPAELNNISDGVIGLTVRYIPERKVYQVLDKDANIIEEVSDRKELFWEE